MNTKQTPAKMSDLELGKFVMTTSKQLIRANKALADAHQQFKQNIAFYYEVKQRLRNPRHRSDLPGHKNRTAESNRKNFGAPDWEKFVANLGGFSLQHANRLLKEYAVKHKLIPAPKLRSANRVVKITDAKQEIRTPQSLPEEIKSFLKKVASSIDANKNLQDEARHLLDMFSGKRAAAAA